VKNIVAETAMERDIPVFIFRPSRVGNQWILTDWHRPVRHPSFVVNETPGTLQLDPTSRDEGLYRAPSLGRKEELRQLAGLSHFQLLKRAIADVARTISVQVSRFYQSLAAFGFMTLAIRSASHFYGKSLAKEFYYRSAFQIRVFKFVFRNNLVVTDPPASRKFVLIPLHARPESSTLTRGRGKSDEDVIAEVISALRESETDVDVFALENAACIGNNRTAMYRNCRTNGVVVLSPLNSTQEWLRSAWCVVGLSGTALLEANLIGVPAFACGYPEFRDALDSADETLADFFRNIATATPRDFSRAHEYRAWVLRTGLEIQIGSATVKSRERLDAAVDRLFELWRGRDAQHVGPENSEQTPGSRSADRLKNALGPTELSTPASS